MSWIAQHLSIENLLALKKAGSFRIETVNGRTFITVHRPGEDVQRYLCASPGVANQARLILSDEGMAGYIEQPAGRF